MKFIVETFVHYICAARYYGLYYCSQIMLHLLTKPSYLWYTADSPTVYDVAIAYR